MGETVTPLRVVEELDVIESIRTRLRPIRVDLSRDPLALEHFYELMRTTNASVPQPVHPM